MGIVDRIRREISRVSGRILHAIIWICNHVVADPGCQACEMFPSVFVIMSFGSISRIDEAQLLLCHRERLWVDSLSILREH